MKKSALASLAAAAACVLTLAGCGSGSKIGKESGNVLIDVKSVVFTADDGVLALTDATSVKDYMTALAANGELVFSGSESGYGFYIESVFATCAEGNAYWAVYTDLVKLDGVVYSAAEYGTFTYKGKTLNQASFGVSSLPCVAGYTYALVYSEF